MKQIFTPAEYELLSSIFASHSYINLKTAEIIFYHDQYK